MLGSRTPPFPAISRANETVATCPYSDTPLSAGTCVVRLTGVSSLVSRVGHLPEHRPRGFLHHIRQGDSRGSLTQILILLEDTITSGLIEKPANNLKKGGPFDYLDTLVTAVLTLLLSLFGLPWVSAMYIRSAQQLQISAGMMDETPEHRDCR